MFTTKSLLDKWQPLLENENLSPIKGDIRRETTAQVLENTLIEMGHPDVFGGRYGALNEAGSDSVPASLSGGIGVYDPVIITLVRRTIPNLIAYDVCGVQPMTGPTGLIFALVPQYGAQSNTQTANSNNAFYYEPNTNWSGLAGEAGANTQLMGGGQVGTVPSANLAQYNYSQAMATASAETLGTTAGNDFNQMSVSIARITATAQSRALKSEYSIEMAQDLKAIHGLDAETELANILAVELLAEINREIIRTINISALQGAATTAVPGTFDCDVDSAGRWSVEKYMGLRYQLQRECNAIAKATRRGRGNIVICSSDVASALQMSRVLDFSPAAQAANAGDTLRPDDTGPTFVGTIDSTIRVFVDPYTTGDYVTTGYRGQMIMDAGLIYAPYVPLQMVRAVGQDSFQPRLGFKSRYAVVTNPFSGGANISNGVPTALSNVFYRSFSVSNLL